MKKLKINSYEITLLKYLVYERIQLLSAKIKDFNDSPYEAGLKSELDSCHVLLNKIKECENAKQS